MNTPQTIDTGLLVYSVVNDFVSVYRALVVGVIPDELFGVLNAPDLQIKVDPPNLAVKIVPGGAFAISGYVEQAFPQLDSVSYTVQLLFTASGYRDASVSVPIPSGSTFPVTASLTAMRRQAVRLQGRVVANTSTRAPIAGASVISVDDPAAPPPSIHKVALRSTLSFAHASGTTVRTTGMNLIGSATLLSDAISGATELSLSTRSGLVAGSVVQLANVTRSNVDYVVVGSAPMGSGAGVVTLRNPLTTTYAAGLPTIVQFLAPTGPGTAGTLSQDADAGDGVLLSSVLFPAATLEIDAGTASVEYHEIGALTDVDGYYAINGIGRSQQIFFEASHAAFAAQISPCVVDFDNPVNILDFRL